MLGTKHSARNLLSFILRKPKKKAAEGVEGPSSARLASLNKYRPAVGGHDRHSSGGTTARTAAMTRELFAAGSGLSAAGLTAAGVAKAAQAVAAAAPSPWTPHVDAESGATFYAHEVTGETSWELPPSDAAASPAAPPGRTKKARLPTHRARSASHVGVVVGQWEAFANEAGTTYYFNSTTGAASWEIPHQDTTVARGSMAAGAWERQLDAPSGEYFYHNTKTGATQWEPPPSFTFDVKADESKLSGRSSYAAVKRSVVRRAIGKRRASMMPGFDPRTAKAAVWTSVIDPASGSPFYHNAKTGETSWERPLEMAVESHEAAAAGAAAAASAHGAHGVATLSEARVEIAKLTAKLLKAEARCTELEGSAASGGAGAGAGAAGPTTSSGGGGGGGAGGDDAAQIRALTRKLAKSEEKNARLSKELDECHDHILALEVSKRQRKFRGSSFRETANVRLSGLSDLSGIGIGEVSEEGQTSEEDDWAEVDALPPKPTMAKDFDRTMMLGEDVDE